MATGIVLDPLAQSQLRAVKSALEADFGVEASQREILGAAIHGATAAHLVGMLIAFTKAKAARDAAHGASYGPDEQRPGLKPGARSRGLTVLQERDSLLSKG